LSAARCDLDHGREKETTALCRQGNARIIQYVVQSLAQTAICNVVSATDEIADHRLYAELIGEHIPEGTVDQYARSVRAVNVFALCDETWYFSEIRVEACC